MIYNTVNDQERIGAAKDHRIKHKPCSVPQARSSMNGGYHMSNYTFGQLKVELDDDFDEENRIDQLLIIKDTDNPNIIKITYIAITIPKIIS